MKRYDHVLDTPDYIENAYSTMEERDDGDYVEFAEAMKAIEAARNAVPVAAHIDSWHEDRGAVLWWKFPVEEPPYAGTPMDDDFPDYMTHWTPILVPGGCEE